MGSIISDKGVVYIKKRRLGAGTFGVVHLVEDPKGLPFVIKVVDNLTTVAAREEAKSEVDILKCSESKQGHVNVIRYFDSFLRGPDLCILMEYAPNGNLEEYIRHCRALHKFLPELEVAHKLQQLLSAVAFCHDELHVIHRDIKPANVLIDRFGVLKLTDFGISRRIANINMFCQTKAGTPYYMPPEMMSGDRYTYKADVWMLGCVLYELMALEMPWNVGGPPRNLDVLAQRIQTQEVATSQLRDRYSRELCRLVLWMLDRDYKKRPTMVAAMKLFQMQDPPDESASLYRTQSAAAAVLQKSFREHKQQALDAPAPVDPPPPASPKDAYVSYQPHAQAEEACVKHIQAAMRVSLNRRRKQRAPPVKPPIASPLPIEAYPSDVRLLTPRDSRRRIDALAQPRKPRTPVTPAYGVGRVPSQRYLVAAGDLGVRGAQVGVPVRPHAKNPFRGGYRAAWQN